MRKLLIERWLVVAAVCCSAVSVFVELRCANGRIGNVVGVKQVCALRLLVRNGGRD